MTKRARTTKKEELKLTEGVLVALVKGTDWLVAFGHGPCQLRKSKPALKLAQKHWDKYKTEVLEYCQRDPLTSNAPPYIKPLGLFKRPWAWWEFDAPEKRREITPVHPLDKLFPYETEKDYLVRVELLTDAEKTTYLEEG